MEIVHYGRKTFSIASGTAVLKSTEITEKPLRHEDEQAFTQRLMHKYGHLQGTVEIVIRDGRPNYAVLKFPEICK
jgi:hypothetical protein